MKYINIIILTILSFVFIVFSLILKDKSYIIICKDQILYLFSSTAQVLAGIIGLTITAYIFYYNELQRQLEQDDTKVGIIEELTKKNFHFILFLSLYGFLGLIFSFISITINNDIIINISMSIIVTEIIAIFYFVIDIVNPNNIKNTSNRILRNKENKLNDNDKPRISMEKFMKEFNLLEMILRNYLKEKENYEKNIPLYKIANYLLIDEIINYDLKNKLLDIIKYRNALVHGSNFKDINKKIFNNILEIKDKLNDLIKK
jgi:hypothetical protein